MLTASLSVFQHAKLEVKTYRPTTGLRPFSDNSMSTILLKEWLYHHNWFGGVDWDTIMNLSSLKILLNLLISVWLNKGIHRNIKKNIVNYKFD